MRRRKQEKEKEKRRKKYTIKQMMTMEICNFSKKNKYIPIKMLHNLRLISQLYQHPAQAEGINQG